MNTQLMLKPTEVRTRAQIVACIPPPATKTWHPVPFGRTVEIVEDAIYDQGLEIAESSFALARNESQLFGAFVLKAETPDYKPTIAFRNSLNKTLSNSLIAGGRVSACSNLDLWAATHMIVRKNSRYAERDLRVLAAELVSRILPEYRAKHEELESWKAKPIHLDQGYRLLGQAYGRNVVTSRQFGTAVDEWTRSSVQEHRDDRSAFGLYAALTQGLKVGSTGNTIGRYARARTFYKEVIGC